MSNDKVIVSNDNAIIRYFKLSAKISMMVVDGTRDATSVADVLQGISNDNVIVSNDNAIIRYFKLSAKISMMVVNGTRDATSVADVLQGILNQSQQKPVFDPVAFIGEVWSFAVARNPRSAALGLLGDYSKVRLSTDWLEGKSSVNGETRRTRILADRTSVPLNADHFLDLWQNKEKIPEEWKNVKGVITFDGDVLRYSNGRRYVLCLCWGNDEWRWGHEHLGFEWDANNSSAVLES